MDVADIVSILKKNIKVITLVPLIGAVLVFALVACSPTQYSATAILSVSSEVLVAGNMAEELGVQNKEKSNENLSVVVDANTTNRLITLTVESSNATTSVSVANEIINNVKASIDETFSGQVEATVVEEAARAEVTSPSPLIAAIAAFLCLIVAVVGLVAFLDALRGYIRKAETLEKVYGLSCLGEIKKKEGDNTASLAALNAFFANENSNMLFLMPVNTSQSSGYVCHKMAYSLRSIASKVIVINTDRNADSSFAHLFNIEASTKKTERVICFDNHECSPILNDDGIGVLLEKDCSLVNWEEIYALRDKLTSIQDTLFIIYVKPLKKEPLSAFFLHDAKDVILLLSEETVTHRRMEWVLHELSLLKCTTAGYIRVSSKI